MQKYWNFYLACKQQQFCGPVNYRDFRETGPSELKWFNSYLTNRYHVVRVHSSVSDPLPVECGVPRGSILGPLLFSIHVNDLPEVPRHCSRECYVDDTKFVCFFQLTLLPTDCPKNEWRSTAGEQLALRKSATTKSRQDNSGLREPTNDL